MLCMELNIALMLFFITLSGLRPASRFQTTDHLSFPGFHSCITNEFILSRAVSNITTTQGSLNRGIKLVCQTVTENSV